MKLQKQYTHLIWDFNGTILDDVQLGIDSVNSMLVKRGLPPIPDTAHYREVFRFPIIEYYRDLGFDFEKEDYYTVLAPEWIANYLAGEPSCQTVSGAETVLQKLAESGTEQVLISATQREQLLKQLHRLHLNGIFSEVYGLDNIHAFSKQALAEDWMMRHPNAVPLFVGDTLHDAEVADAVGADCVLFCGGHQSAERLSHAGKTIIDKIEDVELFVST